MTQPPKRVEPAAGWCETCRSWRHTHPCGREECPCAECGQPWGAHGKFAEACGSFKVRPTEPAAPAPAQGEPTDEDVEQAFAALDARKQRIRGTWTPKGKAEPAPAAEPPHRYHNGCSCGSTPHWETCGIDSAHAISCQRQDRIDELEAELAQLASMVAKERTRAESAEREAEQLRRERDAYKRDALAASATAELALSQLEAARTALAERERAAFMAGLGFAGPAADEAYAAWQATQPSTTPTEGEP